MQGIPSAQKLLAALVITSSAALVTSGLSTPIAAGKTKICKWWLPINVGATGGVRIQVAVPAAVTLFNCSIKLLNTVAPSQAVAMQVASAVFTNALANAGNHWIEVTAEVVNGVNAGTIDLQIAQNTSDALSLTLLQGANLSTLAL